MDSHAAFRFHTGRVADELCQEYLAHALARKGFGNTIPRTMADACRTADTSRIFKLLRPLADAFEDMNPDVFHDLVTSLHVTAETAYTKFVGVATELFADGVKWGRIVGLYALAGAVAVECVRRNWTRFIRLICEWVSMFIRQYLFDWIVDHNGWV